MKRCLAAGMKKDLFLSEEEKERRRKRSLGNRHLSSQPSSASKSATSSSKTQSVSNPESLSRAIDEIDRVNFFKSLIPAV